jgi:predicted dehydrogenase
MKRGLVVGLGSMGRRRIGLIKEFFGDIELCGTDSRPERRNEAESRFGIKCYGSAAEAAREFKPDMGFVCTAPLSHSGIIRELLELGLDVFTEINLVADGYGDNVALAESKGLTLFLSSTQLYRREIEYIEGRVRECRGPLIYRYHVGQYLPDWHPWENYRDFFAGDKRTNGCREILAIELPWIIRAFGDVSEVCAQSARLSSLAIDYPDARFVTLRHETGAVGQLAADVVSRKAVRELEIIGEDIYLTWGGRPDSLFVYDIENRCETPVDTYRDVRRDGRYADNIIENAYIDELAAFFDVAAGRPARRHSFGDDRRVIEIIDEIED